MSDVSVERTLGEFPVPAVDTLQQYVTGIFLIKGNNLMSLHSKHDQGSLIHMGEVELARGDTEA